MTGVGISSVGAGSSGLKAFLSGFAVLLALLGKAC